MADKWYGSKPEKCEVCERPLNDTFIDGRTKAGFWAIMCTSCHKEFGVGLGLGRGQMYKLIKKDGGNEWIKLKKKH